MWLLDFGIVYGGRTWLRNRWRPGSLQLGMRHAGEQEADEAEEEPPHEHVGRADSNLRSFTMSSVLVLKCGNQPSAIPLGVSTAFYRPGKWQAAHSVLTPRDSWITAARWQLQELTSSQALGKNLCPVTGKIFVSLLYWAIAKGDLSSLSDFYMLASYIYGETQKTQWLSAHLLMSGV